MTKKKYTADAFFAGVGGIELGFTKTGQVKINYANEFDKYAGITYKANNKNVEFDDRDVHRVLASDIPDCDMILGGFPCFTEDALVQTCTGFKKINEVQVGDLVLTREGDFQPVVKTMKKMANTVYEVKVQDKMPVYATGNHPFLIKRGRLAPKWIAVCAIQDGDLALTDIDTHNESWRPIRIINKINKPVSVYNLEVAKSHTYTVNSICVHNCQAFSLAGYQNGFNDKRGTLFFEMLRFVKVKRPRAVFCENVKNLVGHDDGNTFKVILEALAKNNYYVAWKVLNACEYGNIPQNRERTYIVAFRNKKDFDRFSFPEKIKLTTSLHDVINFDKQVNAKYYYTKDNFKHFDLLDKSMTNPDHIYQWRRVYARENKSGLVSTLTASMGTGGHNVPLIRTNDGRIRKLTPREAFNVQGYPKDFILPKISDTQLYKQAGNSVVVPVIKRIAEKILKAIDYPDVCEKLINQKYVLLKYGLNNKYDGRCYIEDTSDDPVKLSGSNIVSEKDYTRLIKKNKAMEFEIIERS